MMTSNVNKLYSMKKVKTILLGIIIALILMCLLNTVHRLEQRIEFLEQGYGVMKWDIEELEREVGFLYLDILELKTD